MQNSMHDGIRASTESDRALFFGLRALNKHEAKCTTCVIQGDSCAKHGKSHLSRVLHISLHTSVVLNHTGGAFSFVFV